MQVHSNAVHHGHHHQLHNNSLHHGHPTHVTMNINMNMYGNVTNINLHDTGITSTIGNSTNQISLSTTPSNNNSSSNQKVNLNDHIKLDINDFTTSAT